MKALVAAVLLGAAASVTRPAPCAAQDRWQLTLHSDTILWDLQLARLADDTLVVRRADGHATLRIPIMHIDELRLVQKSAKRAGDPDARTVEAGLMGTDDLVFRLTLRDRAERLEVIRRALREHPPARP